MIYLHTFYTHASNCLEVEEASVSDQRAASSPPPRAIDCPDTLPQLLAATAVHPGEP